MISSVYPHKKVSCCPHIPNSNPKFHFWTSVFLHFFLLFFYFASAAGGVSHHAFDRGRRRAAEARACWVLWSGAGWSRGHQGADGAPRGLGQGRRRFRGVVDVLFLFFPVQSTFFWEACCVLMLEIFGTLGEIEWVTVTWVHRGFLGSCLVIEATDMGILRWFLLQHAWNGYSHYRSGLQTISHGYSSLVTIARMSLFQCCEWVKLRWFHPP